MNKQNNINAPPEDEDYEYIEGQTPYEVLEDPKRFCRTE